MIKTSYSYLFAEHHSTDKGKGWWKNRFLPFCKKAKPLPNEDLLVANNILAEVEGRADRTDHSFQRILTNSLNKT